ncbi:hypothetical protein GCM10011371_33220 [Novosphingobium marinum]|nr:hypothetical protein GCM10011371_33220 [Novosphingobium marinum]
MRATKYIAVPLIVVIALVIVWAVPTLMAHCTMSPTPGFTSFQDRSAPEALKNAFCGISGLN